MRRDHGPDDRLAEDLLRGRSDALGAEHQGLADALAAIRHAAGAHPRPSEQLRSVFTHGVTHDELAEATVTAPARRRLPAVLARSGASLRGNVAKVAGLSLLVKLTVGGMAVAVAGVGGAGVAGVLPGQDQAPPAEEADLGQEIADEAVEDGGVDGQEVSERVREPRGDEPGGQLPPEQRRDVREPADEAHDQADDLGEDRPGEDPRDHADEDAERGLEEADRRLEDAPAGERTERSPDTSDDGRDRADVPTEEHSEQDRDRAPADVAPDTERSGTTAGSSVDEPTPDDPPAGPDRDAGVDDPRDGAPAR